MYLVLDRLWMDEHRGTVGLLQIGDSQPLFTIEAPWVSNLRFLSCVPCGEYDLVPFDGVKYTDTWALVGDHVKVLESEANREQRYGCLLHVANVARSLKGCIGPGLSFGHTLGEVRYVEAVWESARAMDKLREILGRETHKLVILHREKLDNPGYWVGKEGACEA